MPAAEYRTYCVLHFLPANPYNPYESHMDHICPKIKITNKSAHLLNGLQKHDCVFCIINLTVAEHSSVVKWIALLRQSKKYHVWSPYRVIPNTCQLTDNWRCWSVLYIPSHYIVVPGWSPEKGGGLYMRVITSLHKNKLSKQQKQYLVRYVKAKKIHIKEKLKAFIVLLFIVEEVAAVATSQVFESHLCCCWWQTGGASCISVWAHV